MSFVSEILIPLGVTIGIALALVGLWAGIMIAIRHIRVEFYHNSRVCPIWSDTLNELMDSDVPVKRRPAKNWVELGPVVIFVGHYPDDYGHEFEHTDYPDRKTQKRLREYIARKHAIDIFNKVLR